MHRLLLILGLCLSLTLSALAKEPSTGLRTALQGFIDQGELAGVVTFVGDREGVLDVQVLGQADREHDLPMRRDTLFRIASMTKPITALGIMQLVEAGNLSVNDPVEKHLPEFRGQLLLDKREGDTVTLKIPSRSRNRRGRSR